MDGHLGSANQNAEWLGCHQHIRGSKSANGCRRFPSQPGKHSDDPGRRPSLVPWRSFTCQASTISVYGRGGNCQILLERNGWLKASCHFYHQKPFLAIPNHQPTNIIHRPTIGCRQGTSNYFLMKKLLLKPKPRDLGKQRETRGTSTGVAVGFCLARANGFIL